MVHKTVPKITVLVQLRALHAVSGDNIRLVWPGVPWNSLPPSTLYPEVAATGGCARLLQLIYLTVSSCAEKSGKKKNSISSSYLLVCFHYFPFITITLSLAMRGEQMHFLLYLLKTSGLVNFYQYPST